MAQKKKSAPTRRAPKKKAASKRKTSAKKKATPWERPAPKKAKHTQLTDADKTKAKQRARRAGRPYPNLVDNMTVAKQKTGAQKSRKKATRPRKTKKAS